jgi:GTPase SAR1 family protein
MDYIKVVFLGLSNVGKSTILSILGKRYSLISNLQPTKAIERQTTEIFGYNVISWDLPGQSRLREELVLKENSSALKDANILIFVFDVQETEQIGSAIDFMNQVLRKVESETRELPYIGVFIHKMDPDIQKKIPISINVKKIQDAVNDIAGGYQVDFFLTSMFMEPTIYIGFSSVFRKVLSRKKQESLKNVLTSFMDQLLLNAIVILDKNNFIVNHSEREENDLKILQDFVFNLISAFQNARKHEIPVDEIKLQIKDYLFLLLPISLNQNEIFVVGSTYDPQISFLPSLTNISSALQKAIK